MGMGEFLSILGNFGPIGIMVAYLINREREERRERKEEAERRATIEKLDIQSRENLAVALNALSTIIQGRGNV